jgi:serine/threonine-protein kinase
MTLRAGARLGPYEIEAPLGAGGMGEVFKARDTRLDRTVAVKILAPAVAADSEFRQRFEREARSISALDHPHVCALYDVGEHEGTAYLVMQYLEGESLAARLTRGPLAVPDALKIGTEIAGALDAAHRRGIVHRDLKPGNVMLTRTGARLLDFGLAKSGGATSATSAGPTMLVAGPAPTSPAVPITAQGTILGTFQYMAPEQIEGEDADARTDLFAFGAVLYEMVTGRHAFAGKTQASLIGAILKDEPAPVRSLAPDVPAPFERVIARCLAKDRDDRWQTARDVASELNWIASEHRNPPTSSTAVIAPLPRRASKRALMTWSAVVIGFATLASLVTWMWLGTRPADAAVPAQVEFSIPAPVEAPVHRTTGSGMAVSPDGRVIVYAAQTMAGRARMLYVRHLDSIGVRRVEGTEGGFAPFFSHDSRFIAFFTDQHLMRVPVAGGTPTPVTDKGRFSRAAWLWNDTIVLGTSLAFRPGALATVAAAGGTPVPLTTLGTGEVLHQLPRALPDGRHVIFSVHTEQGPQLAVTAAGSGTHRLLGLAGSDGRYVAPGTLVFARGEAMFEVPFDLDRLTVTGPEVGILPDAAVVNFGLGVAIGLLDVDDAGNLAYVPGVALRTRQLSWVNAAGQPTPLGLEPAFYSRPRISRDGRRFIVSVAGGPGPWRQSRIRVVDAAEGLPVDLDVDGAGPIWAPDGTITFDATIARASPETRRFVARIPVDNSASPQPLLESGERVFSPEDWAPDGRLLFSSSPRVGSRGLDDRNLEVMVPGSAPRTLLGSTADETGGRISPNSQWLAYESTTLGRSRVYVRPFDKPGGTQTVSGEGGSNPVWARDGSALYFVEGRTMMKAPIALTPFAIGKATALFTLSTPIIAFDVDPAGRFLVLQESAAPAPDEFRVVLGWSQRARSQ